MGYIVIYSVVLFVIFFIGAKKRGLQTTKWGVIGFLGGIISYIVLAILFTFLNQYLSLNIRAAGYILFPISIILMFFVYRKMLSTEKQKEHKV